MSDLINRLSTATVGTQELSAEIARDIVGLKIHDWPNWIVGRSVMHDFPALAPCPAYTTDLTAAWTLIPPGSMVSLQEFPDGRARCFVHAPGPVGADYQDGNTKELAVCIAALMALDAAKQKET